MIFIDKLLLLWYYLSRFNGEKIGKYLLIYREFMNGENKQLIIFLMDLGVKTGISRYEKRA